MASRHKFNHAWLSDERFRGWLKEVQGNKQQVFCDVCQETLSAEITSLKCHKTSAIHSANVTRKAALLESSPSTSQNTDVVEDSSIKDKVTRAEVKLAGYFAEHNIPLDSIDHLIDLSKDIFSDSRVVKSMTLKRSKTTTYVIKDIGKTAKEEIVESLKKNKFSIIIDETTDISNTKSFAVVVKYFDAKFQAIQTRLLDLVEVPTSCDKDEGLTGQHLSDLIMNLLSVHEIPIENLIGFAADGASNIMGQHNSLTSRLNKAAPGITIFKFACHSIHLCASNAVKTLPRKCEDLVRSIYTYFSHSSKRMTEFVEFQEFCYTEPHKILHVSQTGWLSLHTAVAHVLEQWQPLTSYFSNKHLEDRLTSSQSIYNALQDPSLHIYFQFLGFILPYFDNFNKLFQKTEPNIHLLYKKCRILYADILRLYYVHSKVTDSQLNVIDPSDANNFLPLTQVFLGSNAHKSFLKPNIAANETLIADIKRRCRQFMVTACVQIKEKFSLNSKLLQLCGTTLSVTNCLRDDVLEIMPTLCDLLKEVPRIYSGDAQKLDNEWRHIPNVDIPEDIKASNNAEAFFLYLANMKNENGQPEFKLLPMFALNILSLPTSNADAERIFSKMNLIKTKTRNGLSTSTQAALAIVSETVKREGGCVQFEPSAKMIKVVQRSPEQDGKVEEEQEDDGL